MLLLVGGRFLGRTAPGRGKEGMVCELLAKGIRVLLPAILLLLWLPFLWVQEKDVILLLLQCKSIVILLMKETKNGFKNREKKNKSCLVFLKKDLVHPVIQY